jgi:hypothetical protein
MAAAVCIARIRIAAVGSGRRRHIFRSLRLH